MDFGVSAEHEELLKTIRRFIEAELAPLEELVEETGFLPEEDAKRIF